MSKGAQKHVKDKLFELLLHILARVFLVQNIRHLVLKLFRDELALQRSIEFASGLVTSGNVLGESQSNRRGMGHPPAHDYALKRSEEWDATDRRASPVPKATENRSESSS